MAVDDVFKQTDDGTDQIAKLEGTRVRLTKHIVILVFFVSATVVSVATYLFTNESEKSSFEIEVSLSLLWQTPSQNAEM